MSDEKRLQNYKIAIDDYVAGAISLDECLGWIHYYANHPDGMSYEMYLGVSG